MVGGSGAVALFPSRKAHAPRRRLFLLDETTFAILAVAAERMIPKGSADAIEVAHRVDISLCYLPQEAASDINRALLLLENGLVGVFTRKSPLPFTRLAPSAQEAALDAWADSRFALLRGAFGALRKLCLAAYYATIEAGQEVGYPGPPFLKADPGPIVANQALSPPWVAASGYGDQP